MFKNKLKIPIMFWCDPFGVTFRTTRPWRGAESVSE